jgi:hypothetical protein
MSTAANRMARASHSSSVPPAGETSYLSRPVGRIGYDVAGDGSLVVLVPGMGDLRAAIRQRQPSTPESETLCRLHTSHEGIRP